LTPVTGQVTLYSMIKSFQHKGLKKLFELGQTAGINPQHEKRLRKILALLETSETAEDMDLPGLDLHRLKGKRKDTLAVKVTGNLRVTFKLQHGDVLEVDYEDYH
jgi:toxin HigB-1